MTGDGSISIRRKLLKGGGVLMGGQLIGQGLSFIRNVVVARLLGPEDFGIAAMFALFVSMLEMISYLAVDRLLVQAEDGDKPAFQDTAHTFQVLRGIAISALLFLLAWPFSSLMGIPQALWAFQCLALVPLMRGFAHLDIKRLHRELRFGPDVASELIPQVFLVLAVWPFAWWFKDYSAMLWLLVFQAAVFVAISHIFAKRRYNWAWERSLLSRIFSFGWPLLLDGVLMFLIFQGERLLIGGAYDMTQLGIYAAAYSITFVPTMILIKAASGVLLPLLSSHQRDVEKLTMLYAFAICALCLASVLTITGFIFLGERFAVLTFGGEYAGIGVFIGWLAIMQMFRLLRAGPTIASLAWGDTTTPLMANIGRISVFPIAIWIALMGKPLTWLIIVGCGGEFIALLIVVMRLQRSQRLPIGYTLKPVLLVVCATSIAYVLNTVSGQSSSWIFSSAKSIVIVIGTFLSMFYTFPYFRRTTLGLIPVEALQGK